MGIRPALAMTIATFASVALAQLTTVVGAQSVPPTLYDRDPPKIDVYPRYPVSKTFSPGPSEFINTDRAPVSVTIYSTQCPPETPFDIQLIKTSMLGNRIDVSPVRFGYQPICGFVGSHFTAVVYSVFLRELGPGTYQVVVSGEPGDGPPGSTASTITTMVQDFVVLNLDQAGKAVIENPAPGKVQSGIGLISGWACVADSVEISIDGGVRIKVPGEMDRADVKPTCGHGSAGFGLLTNFNLLGSGSHTVQVYVKGVPIGQPNRFNVIVPAGEFITGVQREATVTDFPAAGKTATVDWREAEQNFGLKDVR